MLFEGVENLVAGDHDAHVDDLKAVAGEDDADNVFSNVVYVAFDGGHDDLSGRVTVFGETEGFFVREIGLVFLDERDLFGESRFFLGFHDGLKEGDRFFHHSSRFDDLGKEHFAGSKEVAHDRHAVHERAFDNGERFLVFGEGFLGVFGDEFVDAAQEGVFESLLDGVFAPREVFFFFLSALAFEFFCDV